MQLSSLYLRRNSWQTDAPVTGELELSGDDGKITLKLTEQNCHDILAVVASRLIEQSRERANALTAAIIDATKNPALPPPD